MKGTCRVHSELFWHLYLIEEVARSLIDADLGNERFWGRLRALKELMRFRSPSSSNEIDESVIHPDELLPVLIGWFGFTSQSVE
jgi:hypothetical protein